MTAVITDKEAPKGDVRGAKVSFYLVNGTTLSPISSAQNLPVGLIDVTDGSIGAASAIVQLNIGSSNAASFQVAIKVTGAYTNNPGDALSQCIVTVSKPVAGGYICGGSQMSNTTNSSGYIKGAAGYSTDFQFDIQYTKSGTNPKGKVKIMVRSYYKPDGVLDSKLHTYIITTNAIALLNVGAPTATGTFSAKANMVEQLDDLSTVGIESGATFQMVAFQCGSKQQLAITYYRKAGGIWFSSNWDALNTKTILQNVSSGSNVWVAGGSACTQSSTVNTTNSRTAVMEQPAENKPFNVKAYPNPTEHQFSLVVEGGSNEKIAVVVYDVLGRIVKHIEKSDGQLIRFGEELKAGAYIADVRQGINRKTIKLVKQ
jgi:hypothetical protein